MNKENNITGSTGTHFWTTGRKRKVRCKAETITNQGKKLEKLATYMQSTGRN